jgi:hypothetical protein
MLFWAAVCKIVGTFMADTIAMPWTLTYDAATGVLVCQEKKLSDKPDTWQRTIAP